MASERSDDAMGVRAGPRPRTWYVGDGVREYLVDGNGERPHCNCGARLCPHRQAAERVAAQAWRPGGAGSPGRATRPPLGSGEGCDGI
jgi:hypothetical protein